MRKKVGIGLAAAGTATAATGAYLRFIRPLYRRWSAVFAGSQGYFFQLCMPFRFEGTTQGPLQLVAQPVGLAKCDGFVTGKHPFEMAM